MNNQGGLVKARQQFMKDLHADKDFIEYKSRCKDMDRAVVAGNNRLLLEKTPSYVRVVTYIR